MTSKCGNLRITGVSPLSWPSTELTTCSVQCAGQSFLNYEARLFDRKTFLHSSSFLEDAEDDKKSKAASSSSSSTKKSKKNQRDLLQMSELELAKLSHYEILGDIPMHSSYEQIKRAYHKSCLQYHPDKTGRGEDDDVFLKVKAAFDTLSDVNKRKSYDSTVDFDDAIPKGGESEKNFYKVYGPVFTRNLRFAACNDPANMDTINNSESSSNNAGKKKRNKSAKMNINSSKVEIPEFGDDDSPIEQVHAFYDFWIHFDSWRDFTLKATEQTEHDVDAAEGRDEKRWMAKEIDRKAKAMKREEMSRITKLVERAMAADPRLKREKIREKLEKERIVREKKEKAEKTKRLKEEAEAKAKQEREEREKIEKEQKAKDKAEREKEKKQLRKAKQQLRKSVLSAYQQQQQGDDNNTEWETMEDMNDDIELLCAKLSLVQITSLNTSLQSTNTSSSSLELVHESVTKTRQALKLSTIEHNRKRKAARDLAAKKEAEAAKSKAMKPWSRDELSALAKGVKKYPPGGSNRWDSIANFVNGLCHKDDDDEDGMRSREECIEAYNNASSQGPASAAAAASASGGGGSGGVGKKAAAKSTSSTEEKKENDATTPKPSSSSSTPAATSAAAASSSSSSEWTEEQDKQLQEGLAKYPASMDKNERWTAIAKNVNGKGKKDCVLRFKAIRSALKKK